MTSPGPDGRTGTAHVARGARLLLAAAAVAVAFAAADTYVVVLALPEMMGSVGIPVDELQRAAPIVSGFLLGYVAMLPLIGRIADLHGRVPVLVMSLVVFAAGSLLTGLSYDMTSMVSGRFLQGVGGGGLVPATLALVADLYPVERRGVPLGIVSAVQEIGSVLGPLFGAAVIAFADWRVIFAINLLVGVVLALAVRALAARTPEPGRGVPRTDDGRPPGRTDWIGAVLLTAAVLVAALAVVRPGALMRDLTWGAMFVPYVSESRWLTPVGLVALGLAAAFVVRLLTARTPLVDVRAWGRALVAADLLGATFLALALGGVILAFATADPRVEVFSPQGGWYLLGSAIGAVALAVHLRRASDPLVPRGAFRRTPAWGSLVVSFLVGAGLIAALIDIPLFARSTIHADSQLMAALVLVRFLLALPVGAVVGGLLVRHLGAGVTTAVGMALSTVGFAAMSRWGLDALEHWESTLVLVVCGFGFGLALAPVNAAVLAFTDDSLHGLASAFVVVARMVGMLVGISALTTLGLRRYYAASEAVPDVREVCEGLSRCSEYTLLLREAGVAQENAVFLGAAFCTAAAGLAALLLLRRATRSHVGRTTGLGFHHG